MKARASRSDSPAMTAASPRGVTPSALPCGGWRPMQSTVRGDRPRVQSPQPQLQPITFDFSRVPLYAATIPGAFA